MLFMFNEANHPSKSDVDRTGQSDKEKVLKRQNIISSSNTEVIELRLNCDWLRVTVGTGGIIRDHRRKMAALNSDEAFIVG